MTAARLGIAPEVIDAQFAHAVADSLGRACNRNQAMMQAWADDSASLKSPAADLLRCPASRRDCRRVASGLGAR